MPDDSQPLLVFPRQVAGDIGNGKQRNVEGVTEPDEPGDFVRSIDVKAAGKVPRPKKIVEWIREAQRAQTQK